MNRISNYMVVLFAVCLFMNFLFAQQRNTPTEQLAVLSEKLSPDDITEVNRLLKAGANINVQNKDGATPLFMASQNGIIPILELLLSFKASVNTARIDDGITPLFIASQQGYTEIVRILLNSKPTVDAANKMGATPLFIASGQGHNKIVKLLLQAGANVNIEVDLKGTIYTPLSLAKIGSHKETIKLLKQYVNDFKSNCDYANNLAPDVSINFVGGIEFEFVDKKNNQEKGSRGKAVMISSDALLKPIDIDDAMNRLKVGNITIDYKEYLFHEKEQTSNGFILRWVDSDNQFYISMRTLWNDFGKTMNLGSSTICFSKFITMNEPLKRTQIKEMQKTLIDTGFLKDNADGMIGSKTVSAIRKYQIAHNIEVTGEFDRTTIFFLLTY